MCKRIWTCIVFIIIAILIYNVNWNTQIGIEQMEKDYDFMWEQLENNYPFFESIERIYGINRKDIYNKYKTKLSTMEECTLEDFYSLLDECLNEFRYVGHLSVVDLEVYDIYREQTSDAEIILADRKAFLNPTVIRTYEYFREIKKTANGVMGETESIELDKYIEVDEYKGVPVIDINSFYCATEHDVEKLAEHLSKLFKKYRESDNIIFDLRGNTGGNSSVWEQGILPHLGVNMLEVTTYSAFINGDLNQSMLPIDIRNQNTFIFNEFTRYETKAWNIKEVQTQHVWERLNISDLERCDYLLEVKAFINLGNASDWVYDGKIWILIDKKTASAAATMAFLLQNTGIATIVGPEGSGKIGGLSIPPSAAIMVLPESGIAIRYAMQYEFNQDGSCREYGMLPDVVTESGTGILQ